VIPETLADLTVPVASLRLYGRNPRRGDVQAIKKSLEAHGQYRPLVVNRRTSEVLAGNHTLAAAIELGWTEIAATFVDVDDEQAARIVLVDNRTADLAGYDDAQLAELLASLDGLDGTGWRPIELDRLLDQLQIASEGDAGRDTEPGPAPAEPVTRPGDVWRLGNHRVGCGDCTLERDVDRLLTDVTVEMVWTDPPYGVDYHDSQGRGLTNDETNERRLYELLRPSLTLAADRTRPGGAIYMAHSDVAYTHGGSVFRRALIDGGWRLRQVLIWVKNAFVLSRQDYHWQHEPILYGWKPGAAHRWNGSAAEATVIDDDVDVAKLTRRELVALVRQLQNGRATTVIREDRPLRADLHPTMKPVALVARCVANSSRRGEIIYEPFAGSGTTLIAAENLGRVCYALEFEAGYCDVIVDRWERHTGRKAVREKGRRQSRAAV
jgi:site-specific DNA-methyltransferase (adenine-specific)